MFFIDRDSCVGQLAVSPNIAHDGSRVIRKHAGHRAYPHPYYAHGSCAYHEPGNPYTPQEDYIAWSAWRSRGGWDDRKDWNCVRGSRLHYGAGF